VNGHLERKGRLKINPNITESLDRMLNRVPVREAPFNFAVASQACRIHLPQGDSGDVLLAATALVFGLTLVTQDGQFIDCTWLKTLSNG
jgi:PIN domain nuclease of toxin-antitoxin system